MSIPVMLAFDARSVLTLPDTGFSNGKPARMFAEPSFDERFFRTLPFEDIYHDGPPVARGEEIRNLRMSEVVHRGPLPIDPHLKYIVCRTRYDRITLLDLLEASAKRFRPMITTEQTQGAAFIHKALYIQHLTFEDDRLIIEFNRSFWTPASGRFRLKIEQYIEQELVVSKVADCPIKHHRLISSKHPAEASSVWRIEVEDVLAFQGVLPAGKSGVF